MRTIVFMAIAILLLAGCATNQMPGANAGAGQQQASDREAPTPPALRTPRQRSGTGWPDLGYRPYGN
jgi:hypothetical protein